MLQDECGGERLGMILLSKIVRVAGMATAAAIAVAIGLLAGQASATNSKTALPALLKNMRPMQVRIVRSAQTGCEPDCAQWISAEGDIVEETPAVFQRVLASLGNRKLPVFVNSGGGSIEAAMSIGRLLRGRGLDVSVTRTDFVTCAADDRACAVSLKSKVATDRLPRGLPNSFAAYCASACSLVLASGVQRLASSWSHVGVHSIIVFRTQYRVRRTYRVTTLQRPGGGLVRHRTLIHEQTIGASTTQLSVDDATYRPILSYLKQMGIDASLVPLMEATPNSDIHWMSKEEEDQTRLVSQRDGGEVLLKLVEALPASAIVSAPPNSDGHQVQAEVPTYYQGRSIALHFEATYDKAKSSVELSVEPKDGNEALRTQGLVATFGLGGDHTITGSNPEQVTPFGPLKASVSPQDVCQLREAQVLRFSVHPAGPQEDLVVPLGQTTTMSVAIESVRGLSALLNEACGSVAAAKN